MKDQAAPAGLNAGLPFRRINFVRARDPGAHSVTPHVDLVPLNSVEMPSMLPVPPAKAAAAGLPAPMNGVADDMAAFCSESAIKLNWACPRKAGSGLVNLGNTCFMNSVLQALTHTPPLAELCLRDVGLSTSAAERQHLDPIAAMQAHIKRALNAPNAVQPVWHARNLKAINRRFRLGRQEDAHEYLRCVLDAMHEAFLKHIKPKPPPELASTTFIHRIFGGKLRSEIVCEGVDYRSATFDPFLDLSLEINKANSLTRALQHFTAEEVLDGDNRYRCPKNNKLVKAYKRISIENAPNVLTVHLKRFDFFGRGHKITKKVEFGMQLDLGPFMTSHLQRRHHHKHKHHHKQQQQQHAGGMPGQQQQHHHHHSNAAAGVQHHPVMYDLYGVLVHHGHSLHSGHYVCFVKAGNGIWHHCDDHRVAQVSERMVEGQQAYILFYVRRQPKGAKAGAVAAAAAAKGQAAVAALGHAAASAAAAAAAAANRQQQQPRPQQLDRSKMPAVVGSGDRSVVSAAAPPAAAAAAAAAAAPSAGGEAGSASAAEGRKVAASSTASTLNASPVEEEGASPQPSPVEFTITPSQLQALLHNHHHHYTRGSRRMLALNSFERHMHIASEAAAFNKLQRRHSKRLSLLQNGGNGHSSHNGKQQQPQSEQQQQQAPRGLLGGSPAKQPRHIRPQMVVLEDPQQQLQQDIKSLKRQRQQPAQEQQQEQRQQHDQQPHQQAVELQQQQPDLPDAGEAAGQHVKRRKHKGGSSKQEQQHSVEQLQQRPQQQQPQQPQQEQRQQQVPQPAAGGGPAKQQQAPQLQPVAVGPTVTGAAALELLMSSSRSSRGPAASGWEGGDAAAAAQAAALQRAAAQQVKRKERDEWDVEYDRGKTKKVRNKQGAGEDDEGDEGGNRFQQAWQQQLPQKAREESWKGMDGGQQRRGGGRGGRGHRGGHRGGGAHRGGPGGRGRGGGGRFGGRGGGGRGRGGGGRGRGRGRGR